MLYYNLVIAHSGLSFSVFLGFFTLLVTKKIGRVARKYGHHFQRHFLAWQWQRAWDCCCRVLPAFITTFKTLCKTSQLNFSTADCILNNTDAISLVNKNWCNIRALYMSSGLGQLTLFQPGGTDYAHQSTTGTPGISDLPTALVIHEWWSWCCIIQILFFTSSALVKIYEMLCAFFKTLHDFSLVWNTLIH